MTVLQRCILWSLRQSHRWERLACVLVGRALYQKLQNVCWQLYLRKSLSREDRTDANRDRSDAQTAGRAGQYLQQPSYAELGLMILTGVVHVTLELSRGGAGEQSFELLVPERLYNAVVSILWGLYVLWRAMRTPGIARAWGFRRDNLWPALRTSVLWSVPAAAFVIGYGAIAGRMPIPATFWMILLLYPVWGIAQQFALQALITKNLRTMVPSPLVRAAVASSLFSAAHFPNLWLTGLTFPAALLFTWLYERQCNLWAVGTAHGLLGALAYYLVLGQDPGAQMLKLLRPQG